MNNVIKYNITGGSHSDFISIEVEGFEKGFHINMEELKKFMQRRKASNSSFSTSRIEDDEIVFESGVECDVTTGEKIVAKIFNKSKRSNDYDNLKYCPRPSHADFSAYSKYGLEYDMRGGGKFSGRLTACMCIAGGIAKQILEKKGVFVNAYISSIGEVKGLSYKSDFVSREMIEKVSNTSFPVLKNGNEMLKVIEKAKSEGDSVGGIVECICTGIKAGIGDTFDNGLESKISANVFAIPAVKGVEFGLGFDISQLNGSKANDCYFYDGENVRTKSNNNGGINGGISNGMPITLSVAFKPTPSISIEQDSVNLKNKENIKLQIKGRHDACIVPRAVPVVEAMVALAIYNEYLVD